MAYNIANDGKERIYQEYSYNKDLQKYELAKKQTCEWVNHPSLRLSKTCSWIEEEGETYYNVYYAPVNDDGTYGDFEDYFYLFKNGDYTFCHFGSNDDIYTFFNANGQETRKIRIRFNDENSFEIPSSADEFKNGEWLPLISEEVKVGELEDRFTFRTNEKGIVIWSEDYISDKLDLEVERTLLDNGYIEKSYVVSDQSGKKYLEEQITYTTLSDGSQENIDIEYDEDGNVTSKKKNILDANGVRFQYSWDDTTNNWSPDQNTYVSSIITTASDGTKTTIYRRFQDGKIEEISKQVTGTTDNSTWVEEYSKEGDSWTPLYKTVKQNYQVPSFGIVAPKNPLPEFFDDKFFGGLNIIDGKKGIDELHYNWDANKKDWILQNIASDHKYEIETTSDPATIITVYEKGYGYKYCIDEQKRLTMYMGPSAAYMYSYNDEGQLYKITDMTERGYQNIKIYILEYGKINVTDAIDKPNLSVRNNLIITGRTIKAVDCHKILLYNLDGALISKSYEKGGHLHNSVDKNVKLYH